MFACENSKKEASENIYMIEVYRYICMNGRISTSTDTLEASQEL